jgi:hypothetical protein
MRSSPKALNLPVMEDGVLYTVIEHRVPRVVEASHRKMPTRKRGMRGVSSIANATLGASRMQVVQVVGRLA